MYTVEPLRMTLTHLPQRDSHFFTNEFFKLILRVDILSTSCEIGLRLLPQNKIGSDNGFVPSGIKPLPEPMVNQIYVAIRHH